jgi:hypothetical protein
MTSVRKEFRKHVADNLFAFSTGRRIGLSLDTRVVAGSSPAFGSRCRSSSVVEHVIPTSFLIRRYSLTDSIQDCASNFSGPKILDYRTL